MNIYNRVLLATVLGAAVLNAQTLTTSRSFVSSDATIPAGGLVQAINGNLYGTAAE